MSKSAKERIAVMTAAFSPWDMTGIKEGSGRNVQVEKTIY